MSPPPETNLDGSTIDGDLFVVLINDQGQHSLWPAYKAAPDGWTCVHPVSAKAEALAYVEANWTDMRPISLRRAMDQDRTDR